MSITSLYSYIFSCIFLRFLSICYTYVVAVILCKLIGFNHFKEQFVKFVVEECTIMFVALLLALFLLSKKYSYYKNILSVVTGIVTDKKLEIFSNKLYNK